MKPEIERKDGRTIIRYVTDDDGKKYVIERDITLQENIASDLRVLKWLLVIAIFVGISIIIVDSIDAIYVLAGALRG